MTDQDLYLFAIVDPESLPSVDEMVAFEDKPLQIITTAGLAAVTTAMPARKLRPQRSNLKIHHTVIDRLNTSGITPLPFAFGSATREEALKDFLETHQEALKTRLAAISGCVEIGLRLRTPEGQIFSFVIAADEALRKNREALYAEGRTPSREEQIALGQRFESSLNLLRFEKGEQVQQAIEDLSREVRPAETLQTEELAHMLILIPREHLDAFDARIETLAATLPDELILQISPPLAPYSFVDLAI